MNIQGINNGAEAMKEHPFSQTTVRLVRMKISPVEDPSGWTFLCLRGRSVTLYKHFKIED